MARSSRRDSNKKSFWRNTTNGHARSGLAVRDWCRRSAVTESSFFWWRRELAQRELAQRDSPRIAPIFVPLRSIHDTPGSANTPTTPVKSSSNATRAPAESDERAAGRIEILLPGPRRVRLIGPVDRQALADVLAVLMKDDLAGQAGGNARRAEAGAC